MSAAPATYQATPKCIQGVLLLAEQGTLYLNLNLSAKSRSSRSHD